MSPLVIWLASWWHPYTPQTNLPYRLSGSQSQIASKPYGFLSARRLPCLRWPRCIHGNPLGVLRVLRASHSWRINGPRRISGFAALCFYFPVTDFRKQLLCLMRKHLQSETISRFWLIYGRKGNLPVTMWATENKKPKIWCNFYIRLGNME